MPDPDGKYYFSDYVAELQARGFDGFSASDLGTYVNRGYFHVARKNLWYWEQTTDALTVVAGSAYVDLWPTPGGELPNFRSLDKVYVTTAGKQKKLSILNEDEFFDDWLSRDLTAASNRSESSSYYVWQNRLYILPPPQTDLDILVHYHRRVSAMVSPTDQPLTPVHLDEAILDAALIRCHGRASELGLAASKRADLEEVFDDMRDDEEEIMDEQQERVTPDRTWL